MSGCLSFGQNDDDAVGIETICYNGVKSANNVGEASGRPRHAPLLHVLIFDNGNWHEYQR